VEQARKERGVGLGGLGGSEAREAFSQSQRKRAQRTGVVSVRSSSSERVPAGPARLSVSWTWQHGRWSKKASKPTSTGTLVTLGRQVSKVSSMQNKREVWFLWAGG
jgi:hypothetical protein